MWAAHCDGVLNTLWVFTAHFLLHTPTVCEALSVLNTP